MQDRYARWVGEYSLPLLKWAYGKTGRREDAEDLTQEVWLQFFSAVNREQQQERAIEAPEHLLWKIARYVWCRSLRGQSVKRILPLDEALADPHHFDDHLADAEERVQLAAWLRQRIVNLNRVQREAMILFYIEQLPQQEIARRLGLSDSTLRWHLFDTRKKLRKGASDMTATTEFVYRPSTLHMGLNGQAVPNAATTRIGESLLMQNICCACYREGRTAQELAEMLGVARPYIEHDLRWLTAQEFITENKGRYFTAFLITTSRQEADILRVFEQHKETLCDAITGHLLANEQTIRSIGFTGSEKPMSKLLWLLIYLFTRRLPLTVEMPEPPIRPDGGKYWPLGFDRTEPAADIRRGFDYNGSMCNNGFYWFGLHNFGQSEIEDLMDAWTPEYRTLRNLLEKLIHADFDPACVTAAEQYPLAQLAEKGFVTVAEGRITPNFVILTASQYERLYTEVFAPLIKGLQPEVRRLADHLHQLCLSLLPPHLTHLAALAQSQAQHDIAFITELLAFHDGTLYHPVSKRDGEFLTMAYIFRK
ncbi:MAG: sigma-70 family RNA polymerase sigma factor [Clostridia bacterium]|nr:sigma-70 family RNA polymerase sigma factor [Clostridia bacterium]